MIKWFSLYFDLSKRELNGLLTMVGLIFLIMIAPRVYVLLWPVQENLPSERQAIQELMALRAEREGRYYGGKTGNIAQDAMVPARPRGDELGYFDPNVIGISEWQQLGLSARQAGSVLKYVSKGGRFKAVEDLQKMYTISPEVYMRIAPYVRITGSETPGTTIDDYAATGSSGFSNGQLKGQLAAPKRAVALIEINRADSALLEEIRGIGPAFARRIIKYRERLGGFYNKMQLMEVYGLDSAKYNEVKDQVRIDLASVKKIQINTATFEELRNHPYLRYKQINAIIEYRKQHGPFKSGDDLGKIVILDQETISKLAPYLSF